MADTPTPEELANTFARIRCSHLCDTSAAGFNQGGCDRCIADALEAMNNPPKNVPGFDELTRRFEKVMRRDGRPGGGKRRKSRKGRKSRKHKKSRKQRKTRKHKKSRKHKRTRRSRRR